MTDYTELCDIAEQNEILMLGGKLHGSLSMAICDKGNCTAVFDYSQIGNIPELNVCTAHEIGHCVTGSFYTEKSLELRSRMEYRADKWAIKKLLPKTEIEEALKNGYVEVWQLAEHFEVTEEYVKKAFWIYFDISL